MISKDAKYIVFDTGLADSPIIFPNHVTHSSMAMMLGTWMPVSAGFVRLNSDGTLTAYGESVSLKIKSNPDVDNRLLAELLGK